MGSPYCVVADSKERTRRFRLMRRTRQSLTERPMRRPGDSAVKIRTKDQRKRAFSLGHGHHARLKSDFCRAALAPVVARLRRTLVLG